MAGAQRRRGRQCRAPARRALYGSHVTRHREVSRTGALVARVVAACAVRSPWSRCVLPVRRRAPTTSTTCSRPPRSRWRCPSRWSGCSARRARGRLPDGLAADRRSARWPVSTASPRRTPPSSWRATRAPACPPGADLALAAAWVSNWAWFPASVLLATVYPQVLPYGRPLSPPLADAARSPPGCLVLGVLDRATEPGPARARSRRWTTRSPGRPSTTRPSRVWRALSRSCWAAWCWSRWCRSCCGSGAPRASERWQVGWFGYAVVVAGLLALAASPALTTPGRDAGPGGAAGRRPPADRAPPRPGKPRRPAPTPRATSAPAEPGTDSEKPRRTAPAGPLVQLVSEVVDSHVEHPLRHRLVFTLALTIRTVK